MTRFRAAPVEMRAITLLNLALLVVAVIGLATGGSVASFILPVGVSIGMSLTTAAWRLPMRSAADS